MSLLVPALYFMVAMLACGGLTAILIPRLRRAQVLDIPNARSLHVAAVPRGAGLAIALVVTLVQLALVMNGQWSRQPALITIAVGLSFAALGWSDDRASRSAALRFALQALLSLVFVSLALSPEINWPLRGLWWLAVMWAVNLFNFMDGADGLAGVQTVAASVGLGVLLSAAGQSGAALSAFALAGAAAGFLAWNWHPARVFLGDVGSYFIGFQLAALAILSIDSQGGPWPALILVAPFVIDASLTLCARAVRGVPVWHAHREHVYQLLVLRAWSPARLSSALALLLVGLCWPAAALAVVYGVTPALFVYGLLVIIWLWLRHASPRQGP